MTRRSRHFHCRAISCQTVVRSHGLRDFGRRRSRTAHSVQSPSWASGRLTACGHENWHSRRNSWPSTPLLWTPCGCSPTHNCPAWSSHCTKGSSWCRLRRSCGWHSAVRPRRRGAGRVFDETSADALAARLEGARSQIWRVRWNPTTTARTTMWTATRTQWRSQQSWRPPTCPVAVVDAGEFLGVVTVNQLIRSVLK